MDNYNRNVLLVNEEDKIVGIGKALKTHFGRHLMLHRAFSVFLFNSRNELLVQRRADEKLLFPGRWTNSVCSHPFVNDLSFTDPILDVKVHAIKRIEHELGIRGISIDNLKFVSRVVYKAAPTEKYGKVLLGNPTTQKIVRFSDPESIHDEPYSSSDFYEWEVDYVILCVSDASPCPNPKEVSETKYVSKEEFQKMIAEDFVSPWLDEISKLIDVFDIVKLCFPTDF
ncbi:isopentenyl-diphosphate-delta-isomerase II [Encephalitozoon intestinalis ATCC 50506]|uniref:isopentenyl-diphosphate Delta-isomerase n=1 Tax=Encephalitozoon intestinalis (strain ATCC 50506) TaxID=876142 RepID=E0S5N1_ENCIT|nr:isopentenyl-diphosphate-delta-isomerase II [Encephalitozoon intestinalis ATCC 50506]ADM11016.1 isopentenyl-diphosphate-delta-isomerase II [Encephalitozoon intestinalis ATCC 50506]UTX44663.1 isopentenyl-diphosphate-delta-isomerase II [Encephalitozoon intestinalis]